MKNSRRKSSGQSHNGRNGNGHFGAGSHGGRSHSGGSAGASSDRKTMQLCAQVRRVLEFGVDEVLHGDALVSVSEVLPAPDVSHLLVLVQPLGDTSAEETQTIQMRLMTHALELRQMVAESISRRKAPSLSFQVLPPAAA